MSILLLLIIINVVLMLLFSKKEINYASTLIISWCVQIAFTVLYLGELYFTFWGINLILISVLCSSFGYYMFRYTSRTTVNKISLDHHKLFKIGITLFIIYIFYMIYEIYSNGYSVSDLFNIDKLLLISHENAINRYAGETNGMPKVFNVLFTTVGQLLPCIAGILLPNHKINIKKKIFIIFIGFTPAIFEIIYENVKANIIATIILVFVFYCISSLQYYGKYPSYSLKKIIIGIALAGVLFLVIIASFMLRIGSLDGAVVDIILSKLVSYAFGHLPAFDNWFYNSFDILPNGFGINSFLGIFQGLGLVNREVGLYNDDYIYGVINTNVYTYFRALVMDFGMIGTPIIFLGIGAISGFAERYIRQGFPSAIVLLGSIWTYALYYIASIFVYVSYITTFTVIYFLLRYCCIKDRNKNV